MNFFCLLMRDTYVVTSVAFAALFNIFAVVLYAEFISTCLHATVVLAFALMMRFGETANYRFNTFLFVTAMSIITLAYEITLKISGFRMTATIVLSIASAAFVPFMRCIYIF